MAGHAWDRVPIDAQSIDAPLSQAAIFLVVAVSDGEEALGKVRDMLGGLDDLVKTVGFRDLSARLSCIAALGSDLWDLLGAPAKPRELKPFVPIEGAPHRAPSTPATSSFTSAPSGRTSASSSSVFCSRRSAMR
jgi:putative iron-dependent peroxidase